MIRIVEKVEIYNQAYKIAWPQIAENARLTAQQRSEAGLFLSQAIQGSIKAGRTDAVLIAVEATADMQRINKLRLIENRLPVAVEIETNNSVASWTIKNFLRSRCRIPRQ